MSKYRTIDVWNQVYGAEQEAYDYAGRLMNIVICHRDTNEEKADSFPYWKANGKRFHAHRVRGSRVEYEIVED